MQIVRSNEELRHARAQMAGSVALVPTMGALHRGHLALIEKAKSSADTVAATIFVNPTQFGPSEDLSRYPRQEALDCEMLENAGCDLVWIPSVEDIYPHGFSTSIHVGEVSERWEGEARAGHFDGVATIVTKLLLSVRPNVALFGEKDFQQLAVIRRFVSDLNIDVTISAAKTVREDDGLALSSRNAYLSHDERIRAGALYQSLLTARERDPFGPIGAARARRGARSASLGGLFENRLFCIGRRRQPRTIIRPSRGGKTDRCCGHWNDQIDR